MDRTEIDKAKKVQQELKEMSKENIAIKLLDGLPLTYKCILSGILGYSFIFAGIYILTNKN